MMNMKMNMYITKTDLKTRTGMRVNPSYPGRQKRMVSKRHRFGRVNRAVAAMEVKPEKCTADELHYVEIPNSDWSLALWRYLPSSHHNNGKSSRNHPLLLLSGVGTNAVGYDLSPQQELSGLSNSSAQASTVANFRNSFPQLNQHFVKVENFQRELDLFLNSDWDLDQLVKDDLPLVVDYIRKQSNPSDGKLFAIGHSMGGILLYAMLSLCGFEGRESHLAAVTTLASSLDYSSSKSSLKLLLPLADPAVALNVPSIPIGAMLAAMHPLAARPPFLLSWLNSQISAQDMMLPELFDKLVLNNFCTVPAKLLLQLTTAFQSTGLCDRSGSFFYKDHLHRSNVPILAIAGDRDLICPPEAVYETIKMIPEPLIRYKVFGEPGGPHYAHYDLVVGRFAAKEVYPSIIEFLSSHDKLDTLTES